MSEHAELLERFRRGPELVAVAVTGAAGAELDYSPGEGKWSIRQILAHLADSEAIYLVRFRRVLAEDNPTLEWCDQDAWAINLDYARRKTSQALETLRRLRAENYELLKDLPDAALDRTGVHTRNGRMTTRDILRGASEHLEAHARQISGVRSAYKASKARG